MRPRLMKLGTGWRICSWTIACWDARRSSLLVGLGLISAHLQNTIDGDVLWAAWTLSLGGDRFREWDCHVIDRYGLAKA